MAVRTPVRVRALHVAIRWALDREAHRAQVRSRQEQAGERRLGSGADLGRVRLRFELDDAAQAAIRPVLGERDDGRGAPTSYNGWDGEWINFLKGAQAHHIGSMVDSCAKGSSEARAHVYEPRATSWPRR